MPYLKLSVSFGPRFPFHRHRRDSCGRRSDAELSEECFDRRARPFNIQLDSTIAKIAHTADQSTLQGRLSGKGSIPYSLHTATHENVCADRDREICIQISHGNCNGLHSTVEYSHTS